MAVPSALTGGGETVQKIGLVPMMLSLAYSISLLIFMVVDDIDEDPNTSLRLKNMEH